MRIITGSSGFLGSHLVKALGKDVVCIPHNKITSYKFKPFDYFYWLSTYGNMYSHTEDKKILQANIIDLISVLEKAIKFNFKSFVFMSTSSVKLRTQTMYSRAKKAAEEILLAYLEKYRTPICIIRPYSVIGVGEQKEHLIPTLIRSCMNGEQVKFTPEPVHDFIDVDDVVNAILNLSEHSARGIFELGTGGQHSNQEILEIVEHITGRKANIVKVNQMRSYDTNNWVSSNYRARSFGWLPRKSLLQSIKEMVKSYE